MSHGRKEAVMKTFFEITAYREFTGPSARRVLEFRAQN
jgi:hypothetical protein